jgi:hypothetical protein
VGRDDDRSLADLDHLGIFPVLGYLRRSSTTTDTNKRN